MKFHSQVYTAASGSVGGLTYSRNRFGMYTRAKAQPVNPNTALQQAARARLAQFAAAWQGLTTAQRSMWATWAAVVSKTDALGSSIFLTAQNWYISVNTQRAQAGVALVDEPSPALALATFTPVSITVSASSDTISMTFDNTDPWANEDEGFIQIYASKPVPATRNFIRGPFRRVGIGLGDSVTPPTSPVVIPVGSDIQVGQQLFVRVYVQDGLGAPSNQQLLAKVAV